MPFGKGRSGTTRDGPRSSFFWQDWARTFDQFDFEFEETVDLGGGVLFVAICLSGRPLGATGTVQTRQGWIYIWAGEAATRVVTSSDAHAARAGAERLANVGDVTGELMTPLASPTTDEMAETRPLGRRR